jgi:hypothetical protein
MSRKYDRKNKVFVGKSLYRQIRKYQMPDPDRDIIMDTKYGKQHLGRYKHPKFLAYIPGLKTFIPFGRMEITKWEYVKEAPTKKDVDGEGKEAPVAD